MFARINKVLYFVCFRSKPDRRKLKEFMDDDDIDYEYDRYKKQPPPREYRRMPSRSPPVRDGRSRSPQRGGRSPPFSRYNLSLEKPVDLVFVLFVLPLNYLTIRII